VAEGLQFGMGIGHFWNSSSGFRNWFGHKDFLSQHLCNAVNNWRSSNRGCWPHLSPLVKSVQWSQCSERKCSNLLEHNAKVGCLFLVFSFVTKSKYFVRKSLWESVFGKVHLQKQWLTICSSDIDPQFGRTEC